MQRAQAHAVTRDLLEETIRGSDVVRELTSKVGNRSHSRYTLLLLLLLLLVLVVVTSSLKVVHSDHFLSGNCEIWKSSVERLKSRNSQDSKFQRGWFCSYGPFLPLRPLGKLNSRNFGSLGVAPEVSRFPNLIIFAKKVVAMNGLILRPWFFLCPIAPRHVMPFRNLLYWVRNFTRFSLIICPVFSLS